MEETNRLKGLDLIDRVPEELWTEVWNIVQEARIKIIPKEKKCKRAKWLLLPLIFPRIRVFSNESTVCIKWPKYWSFSNSPSNKYLGLISFRID